MSAYTMKDDTQRCLQAGMDFKGNSARDSDPQNLQYEARGEPWLRLLILEDSPLDAELEVATLEAAGYRCQWQRVQTCEDFLARFEAAEHDVILADYTLPAFDGLSALALVRARDPDVPFVIISGTIGEEIAIESLKAGATDYVLKSRLKRLVPVVARALAARDERRQRVAAEEGRQQSEARYRELFENANDIVYTHDLDGNFLSINKAAERVSGFTREEACRMNIAHVLVPEHLERARHAIARQLAGETLPAYELGIFTKDGRRLTVEVNTRLIYEHGTPIGVQGIARDTTERKRAEEEKTALLDVAREITGTLDLDELLERVQRLTAAALLCDAVVTFYWDLAQQAFRMISQCGIPTELLPHAQRLAFPRDVEIGGQHLDDRTIVLNDISAEPWWPRELHSHFPVGSLIIVPLQVRQRDLGALVALRTTARQGFDASQVQLCTGIARQLALALDAVEIYRAQQEEARVSGSLVRVGQELISSLEPPVLLERLCQLTAQELQADFSHTLVREPDAQTYCAAAGFGYPPEQCNTLRVLKIPELVLVPFLSRLESDGLVSIDMATEPYPAVARLARHYGATLVNYVPLRRRQQLIGALAAGYRGQHEPFTSQQRRILRGIGQLASLALDTAYLFHEVERANRLKSEFVATMSHELRTPLNIIIGYTDLLREGVFGPLTPEQIETLEHVDASASNLLELINATLDLSRLESGRAPLELKEITLPELVNEIAVETRDACRKSDVTFDWRIAPQLPRLYTDPVKLKVVLKNLIANAVKFTPRGTVVVDVHPRNGGVEFLIADTGIGIKPEILPIIFEPFRQGESSATRHFGGVGLGLYIVRRLLDLLGGTIAVQSEVGRGSTFRVVLPVANCQRAAA